MFENTQCIRFVVKAQNLTISYNTLFKIIHVFILLKIVRGPVSRNIFCLKIREYQNSPVNFFNTKFQASLRFSLMFNNTTTSSITELSYKNEIHVLEYSNNCSPVINAYHFQCSNSPWATALT